jgi:type I restriction-modification system DNA methylase subunit
LPTLDNNIKDGNSLVDTDFYEAQLDFGEEKKIKPFNWQKAFPEVFIHGGFDVVMGNPPYLGGREWKEENGNVYDYFIGKYKVAEYQFDIYSLFWEAGIKLLNQNGIIGFITPNTWLNNQSNKKLRAYILNNTSISKIVDYSKIKVFDQATVLPIITILENKTSQRNLTEVFEPVENGFLMTQTVNQEIWCDGDLNIININLSQNDLLLREKIEEGTLPLDKIRNQNL